MGTYRKVGKQEAYRDALLLVGGFTGEELMPQGSEEKYRLAYHLTVDRLTNTHLEMSATDIRDVFSKALRVERGRRLGKTQMTKLSIDLSDADLIMLDALRNALGYTTKVGIVRDLIRDRYDQL